ncbi:related to zinc finger protein white collar 2 (wc-2) [Sporisorium reilianum f. sp. reilianum]|uniref:Related to zinc finger protein white collar 2 (Wc-2) n=1 Tax=Sporisorium reilianum f. sp. reilianum TaxID=72559 RepID=A0A2N8UD00_9BASI|nr:related to zinc finger protein white collar 2 (wc-2) [Sporisorium reilianum f. sp. reilianum]
MQGQNWSGSAADQPQGFNPPFFNNDGSMNQDAMQSMFHANAPNDMPNQPFSGFDPASSANFSHASQMMMPQHSGVGADPSQRFVPSMVSVGMDPSASAAAAAAYGHLVFNGSVSAPASRRQSHKNNDQPPQQPAQPNDGAWNGMPNSMDNFMQGGSGDVNANMSMRAPSDMDFRNSMNGYEPDGPSSNSSEDSAQGKRRRMTFGHPIQMQGANKPMLMHNDSTSSGGISDVHSMASTPMPAFGPDGQQTGFVRPPFRHRRSRSGSEATGPPGFGQRSFSSTELAPGAQDLYGSGLGYPQPPSLYPAGQQQQQHSHSFVGSQALAAMGGHAASHPPGLGSSILRGVDVSASGSSAATDFTKRKGWTGRVVEELLDFVHVLDPEGTILFASPSVQGLTGWKSDELKGRKLTEFVHPQDVASVEREIDRMRSSKGELLTYYRFKTKPKTTRSSKKGDKSSSNENESSAGDTGEEKDKGSNERRSEVEHADAFTRDGDYIVFEATGHPYFPPEPVATPGNSASENGKNNDDESQGTDGEARKGTVKSESMAPSLSTASKATHPLSQAQTLQTPTSDAASTSRAELQCFFCSARPYPSKNTSMLDSFLELKLENEKLRLLIADMDLTGPDNEHDRNSLAAAYHPDLLKQELENEAGVGAWAHPVNPMFGTAAVGPDGRILAPQTGQRPGHGSRQNSMGSHPTSPLMRTNSARDEVLAGLGVSAGDESDEEAAAGNQSNLNGAGADAAGTAADDARRKKKPKQDDGDHVCTDCGRVDSPEWRKGPLGPKTLCNACGLRWAKKIKRKGGDPNVAAGAMMVAGGGMPPAGGVGGGVGMNVGMGSHMMQHGHPHPFNRANSGQLQGIQMAPPGSLPPGINMSGMINTSPNGFANRGSFEEMQHQHQQQQNNLGGGGGGGGGAGHM